MSSIFISYSRKDREAALRIRGALGSLDRDVWIDLEDIPPSAKWWAEIIGAIESADAFVFLLSPDSAASPVCGDELAHAIRSHKRLVPVLVRDTPPASVAKDVASLNWLLMRSGDDFETAISSLVKAIDTDLDWVRMHSRLLVRASEWEHGQQDDSFLLRGSDLDVAQRWLAQATGKEPQPAPLHQSYLLASQQAQTREIERLRGLYNNALARQLAAQAALLMRETDTQLDRATLLAVESMKRVPNAEADAVLRRSLRLRAHEIARWTQQGDARLLEVSPNRRLVATCGDSDEVVVRTTADYSVVARGKAGGGLAAIAFVPGRDAIVLADFSAIYRFDLQSNAATVIGSHDGGVRGVLPIPGASQTVLSMGATAVHCHALDGSGVRWSVPLPEGVESWTAATNADGSVVALGASDCIVRVVDGATGAVHHELAHDTERPDFRLQRGASDAGISGLAFLDDHRLASAGLDGTVRLWDLTTGADRGLGRHQRDVLCLAASLNHDRPFIVSGSMDRTLRVWHPEREELLATLEHQAAVTSAAWSEDARWLATACGDGTARLWEIDDRGQAVERSRNVHSEWAERIVMADVPISSASDGTVVAWRIGEPDWRGRRHDYPIRQAVPSHDGAHLAAFIDDPTQILYKTADFTWRRLEHPTFVDRLWFTRDGAILTTCWDGQVREFDLETLTLRSTLLHSARVWSAALSADERWVATAVEQVHGASVWARGAAAPAAFLPQTHQVRHMEFSPDSTLLVVPCDDGSVSVWRWAESAQSWRSSHDGVAWWAGFDPSGTVAASAGEDGMVFVHDAVSGNRQQTLAHGCPLSAFAFSPDGRWLAVVPSFEGPHQIHVWDWREGQTIARFGHDDHVHSIDWSADSTLLATASQDGRVRVFDIPNRRERLRLAYEDICITARFVPATQELLSTSYDGSLQLSIVDPQTLVARALARVPRRLTEAEWRRYLPDEPVEHPG